MAEVRLSLPPAAADTDPGRNEADIDHRKADDETDNLRPAELLDVGPEPDDVGKARDDRQG
jgi:hypothetical protein